MFHWFDTLRPLIRVGSIVGKIGAIAATAFGIRQIWVKARPEQSWQEKAKLSTLYALHIGAIGLTAAVMLGSTQVSAPVVTVVVCSSALLKSIAELRAEKIAFLALQEKHAALKQIHIQNDIDFHAKLIVLHDLKETDDLIGHLQVKISTNQALLKEITGIRILKNEAAMNQLQEIHTQVNQQNADFLARKKTTTEFFKEIDPVTFDVDSMLLKLAEQASSQSGILQIQCLKYKKIQTLLKEVEKQLDTVTHAEQKKDQPFLLKRQAELKQRLENLRLGTLDLPPRNTAPLLDKKKPNLLKKYLQQYVTDDIRYLQYHIAEQKLLLSDKNDHLNEPVDLGRLAELIKEISASHQALLLTKLNEEGKSKSVDFGSISAVCALILAIMPTPEFSTVLNPLMLAIGTTAGVVSLFDLYKKYCTTQQLSQNEAKQLKLFVSHKRFQIARFSDTDVRDRLNNQLDKLLQKGKVPNPIDSNVLVSNRNRRAKLVAQLEICEQLQEEKRPPTFSLRKKRRPL
ncbi:hypothetical protein [Candidatus Berkiella aquae]|uniref:Uncharacterized protein n=1 Tax=Candidatus Berkiella aquae TaxID=295108 RepID=A0A0Q9YTZ0_9GAMM|nr:hypothetical protein [Candidatus Berkiella aquae]MCS5711712.1 hypothetical protein [Candidatus Berkiella aquae]